MNTMRRKTIALSVTLLGSVAIYLTLTVQARMLPPLITSPLNASSVLHGPLDMDNWACEGYEGASGHVSMDNGIIAATCFRTDGTDWHYQIHQNGINLEEGKRYTIAFSARSDQSTSMWVEAIVDQADFHDIGMKRQISIGREWKTYTWTFTASGVIKNHILAPQFEVGHQPGTIWLANVRLWSVS